MAEASTLGAAQQRPCTRPSARNVRLHVAGDGRRYAAQSLVGA
jgi:hypothetical protein